MVDTDNSNYPKKPLEGDFQDLTGQRARKEEWLLYTTLVKRTESEHD